MKQFLSFFAILCLASVAHADYLLWTVKYDDYDSIKESVDYVRVGVTETGAASSGTVLKALDMEGDEWGKFSDGRVDDVDANAYDFYVDVTGLSDSKYSFYIELLNENNVVVGRTKTFQSYASLQTSGSLGVGTLDALPTLTAWHGTEFEAVPEPSSMMLLMLGAGLVGLRRKLKKGKKEKRA